MRTTSVLLGLIFWLGAPAAGGASTAEPAWQTLATDAYPRKRDDIVFLDSRTGFYGTGKGNLYRTDDGGATWRMAWSRPGLFIRSLGFVDARHGFLGNLGAGLAGITDATPLYETRDGGATWAPADIAGAVIPGVCSIDILKDGDRVVIHAGGRANGPAKLLRSEDGGATWRLIDLADKAGMVLDVKFLSPQTGFVFAASSGDIEQSHGLILMTQDGGKTWREVYRSSRPRELMWKASFVGQTGYATLQNNDPANGLQRIVKTVDGGAHWRELPLAEVKDAEELGVGFVTARKGWVGTTAGSFETSDGGAHWTPSALAKSANRIRVKAADGTPMIYAIGSQIQVYR